MTKTLLQISSIFLLFVSCKSFVPEGAIPKETNKVQVENTYFSDSEKDYIYRAQVEAYGNEFGGIFILKKIKDDLHRIVLTTNFNFKMLDVEVSQTIFKVNFIAEQLDRKTILKTLEKDFKTLLKPSFEVVETYQNQHSLIYKSTKRGRNYFIFKNKETAQLEKILETNRIKEKVNFSFQGNDTTFAQSINIHHKDLNLKIHLSRFDK